MPGSSVSACHLCHLHSHNHDNLVRTSPLRQSRGKSRHSKYSTSSNSHRHHHGHSNSGYSSRDEPIERMGRSNSSSALARLTDHSHSLPGSRSNSLSRYQREVSTLPDGGDTYTGRGMRTSTSTRSLDLNPPLTSLLDARTTSLPRVSTSLHHTQIHAQPDILVNALPRSRANSRSGSLPRNPVALSQDNSHDYYLDMHRQRFKEEKRKNRFNLQTVMLIGCYSLLVMIAIVVGVVLCYQNGWFGLGAPQEISGDRPLNDNSNTFLRDSADIKNRPIPPDKNVNIGTSNVGNRPRNPADADLEFDSTSLSNNNKYLHTAGIFPTNIQSQTPQRNEDETIEQRNHPRLVATNTNQNRVLIRPAISGNGNTNIPDSNSNQFNPQLQNIDHHTNTPTQGVGLNNFGQSNSPNNAINNPSRHPLIPQDPRNHGNFENLHPGQWPEQEHSSIQGSNLPINFTPNLAHHPNSQHTPNTRQHSNLNPSLTNLPTNAFTNQHSTVNLPNFNSNSGSNVRSGIPLPTTNSGAISNSGFKNNLTPTQNTNPSTSQQTPISALSNSNHNPGIAISNIKPTNDASSSPISSTNLNASIIDKLLKGDTSSLTTQELIDILTIRRMRDYLKSEGDTQTIQLLLNLLQKAEPSETTRFEGFKEEKINPSDLRDGFENTQESSRGSGRNIKGPLNTPSNNFQIQELIEALGGQTRLRQNEKTLTPRLSTSENSQLENDARQRSLEHLINRTINGALIRLVNSHIDQLKEGHIDPNLTLNVTGISIFPVNSEDLKILLESDPKSAEKNLSKLSAERIKRLKILQRLISQNDQKQTVERHVEGSHFTPQNINEREHSVLNFAEKTNSQERGKSTLSRFGEPISEARISDAFHAPNFLQSRFPPPLPNANVAIRNVTSTFNRGETAIQNAAKMQRADNISPPSHTARHIKPATKGPPDPSFAVMIRSDGLGGEPNANNEPVFPPPFISSRKRNVRARTRRRRPIKERVALIKPGSTRRTPSALIRAWTHMDSKGTLSKGQVHSDGSFTFTNCRPAEVCSGEKTKTEETKHN